MRDLIVITGPRGVGKTFLASTFAPPSELGGVFYHDSENSANRVNEQLAAAGLAFGRYASLKDRFAELPGEKDLLSRINAGRLPWVTESQRRAMTAYWQHIIDDLDDNLTPGKFKVYIHDTLEKLEAGMAAWVEENTRQAGVTSRAHGRLWTEGVYPLYEQWLSSLYSRGVETVILCSHLKTPWEDNRPVTGKVVPSGKKILYRLSKLFIWLVNEPRNADGAPAGLILKERMGSLTPAESGWVTRRMLPMRIPHCTWADINAYLKNGCDLLNPAEGESISAQEQATISELLTDEQMRLMILSAEADLVRAQMESGTAIPQPAGALDPNGITAASLSQRVSELAAQGKTDAEIAAELERPLPLIKQYAEKVRQSNAAADADAAPLA